MAGCVACVASSSPSCVGITWDVGGGAGVVTAPSGGGSVGGCSCSIVTCFAARSDSALGGDGTVARPSLAFASQIRVISECKEGWAVVGVSSGARGFMTSH
jgi:hypothetical protein